MKKKTLVNAERPNDDGQTDGQTNDRQRDIELRARDQKCKKVSHGKLPDETFFYQFEVQLAPFCR